MRALERRPHIVLLSMGGSGWIGGRQYSLNLLAALVRARGAENGFDLSVLVHDSDELEQYEDFRPHLRVIADLYKIVPPFSLKNRFAWRVKRSVCGWANPQLEETLFNLGATFAYPLASTKVPSAAWIPDFQHRHFPEGADRRITEVHKRVFAETVRCARHIVLSSACAERDCHVEFPETAGRTSVLPFRVYPRAACMADDPHQVVQKYNLPLRFVLVSNLLAPTKNHAIVLEALAAVPEQERSRMHVVCTGDIYDYRNPGFYNSFLSQIHQLGIRSNISVLGLIPKKDQVQLLRACAAYLQPSLFEGWNTGVEEAHSLGKRIVLSDIPVHREQAPPGATYFGLVDPSGLAEQLKEVFSSSAVSFDPDAERNALERYSALQDEFARHFLALAIPEWTALVSGPGHHAGRCESRSAGQGA